MSKFVCPIPLLLSMTQGSVMLLHNSYAVVFVKTDVVMKTANSS